MTISNVAQLHPAQRLNSTQRQNLALELIKNDKPVTDIAKENKVSRQFLYQQKNKAISAVHSEFNPTQEDDKVLFYLPVTKAWINSFILCLLLHARSSMRGVQKVLRDAFDYSLSLGTISHQAKAAASNADKLNDAQDLSKIKTAAPDEIFHHNKPVLAGVDTRSLYCYLLKHEAHRDSDTWGIHLLDLQEKQNFNPERFIADNAEGLHAGHQIAYPNTPIHGDHFHIIKDMMEMCRFFHNRYASAVTTWIALDDKVFAAQMKNKPHQLIDELATAEKNEKQLRYITNTLDTLVSWMRHDILLLPGIDYKARAELYDFIVDEMKSLEKLHPHRIKSVRISLKNQKTSLLAVVNLLDDKFQAIAKASNINIDTVWEMCQLLRCAHGSDKYAIRSIPLLLALNDAAFEKLEDEVADAINTTDRTSCMIENFNSRLSVYFFLRKEIGNGYLSLLQFYLNHTPFLRSKHEYRKEKTPSEIMTGKSHPHWLEMLGLKRFTRAAA